MLKACIHQFESGETSTPGSPFKQLSTIMSAHMELPGTSLRESPLGLGWIRIQLPTHMCNLGSNYGFLGEAPLVGRGAPSKLILAHYGSMPGYFGGSKSLSGDRQCDNCPDKHKSSVRYG